MSILLVNSEQHLEDPVDNTNKNERGIEIPVGIRFYNQFGYKDTVEVGCVMPLYGYSEHISINVLNTESPSGVLLDSNPLEYDFTGKNVISLGVIEHLGKDETSINFDEDAPIKLCEKIISEANNYIISCALLYNDVLDDWLKQKTKEADFNWCGYTLDNSSQFWSCREKDEICFDMKYKHGGKYEFANSNIFLSNIT